MAGSRFWRYKVFYVGWLVMKPYIALGSEEQQVHYLQNPNGIYNKYNHIPGSLSVTGRMP